MPTGILKRKGRHTRGPKNPPSVSQGAAELNPRRPTRRLRAATRTRNINPPRAVKLETPPETPRSTPPPEPQPTSTLRTSSSNTRSNRLSSSYSGSVPRQNQGTQSCQQGVELQPTVNWDCASHVISDQKVHVSYEKPEMAPCQVDSDGNPIPNTSRVQAYGKMVTKTVTMTVTTTIATTEILRPGEPGYEASLERQKRQREQGPEEQQRQHKLYRESRRWASGDRTMHEDFHCKHHRDAPTAPSSV